MIAGSQDLVICEELSGKDGAKIGIAQLNAPKTLNGLSLEMTRMLTANMKAWADDPALAVIVLKGAGEKAFCAGGDLHALYHSMRENVSGQPMQNAYAGTFFAEEYALDYLIHTYPKPILVWGDGIVMGGGMGLMMGASHRVVTETTRMAMPEISIGLFPDVGGTWLLNRLPGNAGLFLGLTGAQVGASDALFAGMADYHVQRDRWNDLLVRLCAQEWERVAQSPTHPLSDKESAELANNHDRLHLLLTKLSSEPDSSVQPLQVHLPLIRQLCGGEDLDRIVRNIQQLTDHPDPWLQRAAQSLAHGSPGSVRLTFALLRHNKLLSLAEVYRVEWFAGLMAAAHGDFAEGIRALLIDKDKQPKWNPATLSEADEKWVKKFLTMPFPADQHPLFRLGESQ
ncbi:enoyl-CoA hydratase/isomerase family protein [Zwartia vadi]|uniref:enoyl-CoA hydratase/isomerase family protein n=1 Tax=Zwartia vadi TaxID=3058168 RepID=UPI0025B3FD17|nr:enoyl-CoA hydratase/isomerase family protein [Zwartia vadi]MDN3986498.1 enoyl-CoA hydratase/isomerase family protein [Zwartia vadi]